MKIIENITIYKCDFCKKELKRKHAMANHEIKCNNNPDNYRICFNNCQHLERKPITLDIGIDNYISGEPEQRTYNGFYCKLKEQYLIPAVVQNKDGGINAKYGYNEKGDEVEQEFMPKECHLFDDGFNF